MEKVLLGLIAGIAFGFVIQRVGATNSDKMAKAHLMIEPQIPQFMLLAVIFAAIGVFGLKLAGIGRFMIRQFHRIPFRALELSVQKSVLAQSEFSGISFKNESLYYGESSGGL